MVTYLSENGAIFVSGAPKDTLTTRFGVLQEIPARPSSNHSWIDGEWIVVSDYPPHQEQRQIALAEIDRMHARYLEEFTGSATVAERDTWKVKEEAARALVAGNATAGQAAMLVSEAQGRGVTEPELAATIIGKAERFLSLVGIAGGIRAKGRSAILVATDEGVPLDEVEGRVKAVFAMLAHDVQAGIAQLNASGDEA
ncbi:hypothetical protein [Halocynthiibacter styelae]|uniref:Uncharacterized protein n=1 Tax=Halocynthiibacter styelae TaxID=2761955 RepID=A0A8J7LRC1_9RHOB|nr:hypothetical protein [Paenihalocynthiibacter styelae]MBI1495407.1 hypothetical protein [Paenihalocynthiibacter styelae]